jgi:hypothetical protein
MIFIFGFALFGLIVCWHNREYLFGILFAFIMGLFGILVASAVTFFVPSSYIKVSDEYNIPIISMQDNTGVTYVGRTYNSNNELNYFYLYEDTEGKGITFKSVSAKKSYLHFIEDKDEQPYVHIKQYSVTSFFKYLALGRVYDIEYYFYIPEGSVKNNFLIDLQN